MSIKLTVMLTTLIVGTGLSCLAHIHESRMTPDQASAFLTRASEVCRAIDERIYAVGPQTTLVFNTYCGSPSSLVHSVKAGIRACAPKFINQFEKKGGNYNEWFTKTFTNRGGRIELNVDFPYWSTPSLETYSGLPKNALYITPSAGKEMLGSESFGISACIVSLSELKDIPLKSCVQRTEQNRYSVNTSQYYNTTWYDEGSCGTDGSESLTDTVYSGNPLTYTGCGIPSVSPVAEIYTGRSVWEITFDADYRAVDRTNSDDYYWYLHNRDFWNRTRSSIQEITIDYSRRSVLEITLISTNKKHHLKGYIRPYEAYRYTTNAEITVTEHIATGCVDIMCDLLDDDANVIGAYKCDTSDNIITQEYTISSWDPGLHTNYLSSSSSGYKEPGSQLVLVEIAVSGDPLGGVIPSTTVNENYYCNNVTDPMGFGLWYFGVVGFEINRDSCRSTIPHRKVELEIGPVLLEAQFDYCP